MDWIHALLLGFLQGITEYLPVSSSGHLELAKELLKKADEKGVKILLPIDNIANIDTNLE